MTATETLIEVGESYAACWQLEVDEIERLASEANDGLSTMNGDTSTIEITVRQFALLLAAYSRNSRLAATAFEIMKDNSLTLPDASEPDDTELYQRITMLESALYAIELQSTGAIKRIAGTALGNIRRPTDWRHASPEPPEPPDCGGPSQHRAGTKV